jgi:hypothetical protein
VKFFQTVKKHLETQHSTDKFFIKEKVTQIRKKKKPKKTDPNLTAIQCHEIEMSMTLQSIIFLPCLISMHIKHLVETYIRNLVRESHTETHYAAMHRCAHKNVKAF